MAAVDTTSLVPYTRDQLEAILEVLRNEKASLLDSANALDCHQKFGLRSRNYDDRLSLLPMPFNDEDDTSDEDFDPTEEMRERMRELSKRKLALRNAEDSDASSSNKRARTEPSNVTFKFSIPMAKWILRSLDETENELSASGSPGIWDGIATSSEPAACVMSADSDNADIAANADHLLHSTGVISSAEHATAGIVIDVDDENGASPPSNGNYCLGRRGNGGIDTSKGKRKEKETYRKPRRRSVWATVIRPPEVPDEPDTTFFLAEDEDARPRRKTTHHASLTSDPRLVDLLGLESEDIAERHLAHMRGTDTTEAESEGPATWLTEDNVRLAQEKYRIVPNIVSVKTRRPWCLRGSASG